MKIQVWKTKRGNDFAGQQPVNYLVLCRTEIQSSFIMGLGEDWGLIFRHNYLNPSDVLQALNSFIFKLSAFFPDIYKSLGIQSRHSTVTSYVLINILLFAFKFSLICVNGLKKGFFAYERQADTQKSVTEFLGLFSLVFQSQ